MMDDFAIRNLIDFQIAQALGAAGRTSNVPQGAVPLPAFPVSEGVPGWRQPWDVSFAGKQATFTRCILLKGPVTLSLANITHTVTASSGNVYLALRWNTNTGACDIVEGATLASVTDAEPPENEYFKRLLYVVNVTAGGNLRVVEDHRGNPAQVAYV